MKIKTDVKAGDCCWNAYSDYQATPNSQTRDKFRNCCHSDPKCTYRYIP